MSRASRRLKLGWILTLTGCGDHHGPMFPAPAPQVPPTIPPTDTSRIVERPLIDRVQERIAQPVREVQFTGPVDRITAAQKLYIPEGTLGLPPEWTAFEVDSDGMTAWPYSRRLFGITYYDLRVIVFTKYAAETPGGHQHGGTDPAAPWEAANAWLGYLGHPEEAF